MYTLKVSDMLKALAQTWYGWVALSLLLAFAGGTVWAFGTGHIVLGLFLALVTIAYFLGLIYMLYYVFILSFAIGMFLSVFFALFGGIRF